MQWLISYRIYPRPKIMEMGQVNLKKTNTNTEIYIETRKEKITEEERISL